MKDGSHQFHETLKNAQKQLQNFSPIVLNRINFSSGIYLYFMHPSVIFVPLSCLLQCDSEAQVLKREHLQVTSISMGEKYNDLFAVGLGSLQFGHSSQGKALVYRCGRSRNTSSILSRGGGGGGEC